MKTLMILFSFIFFAFASTPNPNALATISKVEGKVKLLRMASIKKQKALKGEVLFKGDKLISYTQAKVVLTLTDLSKVIINENTEFIFLNSDNIKQESGEVYYNIKSRHASRGLKVETPFSIIGIKGTEFFIQSSKNSQVALNEGTLGIESLQASFELHKEKIMSEFENFKRSQDEAFEIYKQQAQNRVVTYVKQFDLEASKVLNFKDAGNCLEDCESYVSEDTFTDDIQKRFKAYQQMLKE
ncbi:MAG: FecR family protein [Campylobacterota bacterium]|nr:FecR family protein [Campylobacterota bacterium]